MSRLAGTVPIFFSTGHSVEPGQTAEIAKKTETKGKLGDNQREIG